jgi:prepilin-type N-terminal cleavage/methylation domain-containing protein
MIHRSESGFTITELMVAIALSAIASVLIVTAFVYTYGNVLVEQSEASMVRQSQLFLRRMVEDIRLSNHVKTSNDICT